MVVVVLSNCPPRLRGDLTKWLQEISAGVYVGTVTTRVREELWRRIQENAEEGCATMVFSANNEQRMDFHIHQSKWEPIDFDGLKLMLRPAGGKALSSAQTLRDGFSKAAQMEAARRITKAAGRKKSLPRTYCAVDVETTGLVEQQHDIIEMAALRMENGVFKDSFNALVQTEQPVPADIVQITGITNNMLIEEGKPMEQALRAFLSFVGEQPVVSHNARFDYGFIRAACRKVGLPPFSNRCIDTYSLARRMLDDVADYKLATLLRYFHIQPGNLHRSLGDCYATVYLYEKLIEIA